MFWVFYKYLYSDNISFKSNKDKVEINCREHGIFLQQVNSHLSGAGCLSCKESKGESEVRNYLFINAIEFIQQKKFSDCVYHSGLSFDFYLPNYNICIEYNGEQHYRSVDYFGGDERFKKQLKTDKIKKEYCILNNILLIVIKYNESVEDVLNEKLLLRIPIVTKSNC